MKTLTMQKYKQFSLPKKIAGYAVGIIFCFLVPPLAPIALWAMFQTELNRRKSKITKTLNDWAVWNIDEARSLGIEPNFRLSINAGGFTGMYLDMTSFNCDSIFEEVFRKGAKNKTDASIEILSTIDVLNLKIKLESLNRYDGIGCAVVIVIFAAFFGMFFGII